MLAHHMPELIPGVTQGQYYSSLLLLFTVYPYGSFCVGNLFLGQEYNVHLSIWTIPMVGLGLLSWIKVLLNGMGLRALGMLFFRVWTFFGYILRRNMRAVSEYVAE